MLTSTRLSSRTHTKTSIFITPTTSYKCSSESVYAIRTTGNFVISILPSDKGIIHVIAIDPNMERNEYTTLISMYSAYYIQHLARPRLHSIELVYLCLWEEGSVYPQALRLTIQFVLKNNITENEYIPICVEYHTLSSFVMSLHIACDVNDWSVNNR